MNFVNRQQEKNPLPEALYLDGANREEKEERRKSTMHKEERHFGFI